MQTLCIPFGLPPFATSEVSGRSRLRLMARLLTQVSHPVLSGVDSFTPDGVKEEPTAGAHVKDTEHLWAYGSGTMTSEQQARLKEMLLARKGAFAYSLKELPGYTGPAAEFTVVPGARAYTKPRKYSPAEEAIGDEKVGELREAGFVVERDTRTDFASAPTMPCKKDADGNWTDIRFCLDLRRINDITVADKYPMPLPETIFRSMEGSHFFTKIDTRAGFQQIPLHPGSQAVTAFWWRNKLYQATRMMFGFRNATAIFQRIMDSELQRAGLTHCCKVFVDDLIIHSATFEEHIVHIAAVLDMLAACGLRAHPAKSVFASDRIEYLGHMVTPWGIEPVAAKVSAMTQLTAPTDATELKSVLGMIGYYRCFVPGYSSIAQPLTKLLKKGVNVAAEWGPEQEKAFAALKDALCVPGRILRHPMTDRQFILHTDWSKTGIGAVLGQLDDSGNEFLVACLSRSLNCHEVNYEPWKGELLAAVWGVKSFRVYLHGRPFELVTDHRPLLWLLTAPEPTGQQYRWVLALQEYDYVIRHRPGVTHTNADVPSRNPLPTTVDVTGARLDREEDDYTGPLPMVVFGPVGTGTPVPVYRLHEVLASLQSACASHNTMQQPPSSNAMQQPPSSNAMQQPVQQHVRTALQQPHRPEHPSAPVLVSSLNCIRPEYCSVTTLAVLAGNCQALYRQQLSRQQLVVDPLSSYECGALDRTETQWGSHMPPELDECAKTNRLLLETLQVKATSWVQVAARDGPHAAGQPVASSMAGRYTGCSDREGVKQTAALCTLPVTSTFFTAAQAGIVLYEPFGGICAGLEMVLRNGTSIHTYIYSDIDFSVRQVATFRVQQLHAQFPHLLPASAIQNSFNLLPQDVWQVGSQQLSSLAEQLPRQWLVVGGWECSDLSAAGNCQGLQGSRSSTFFPLLFIIGALQQLQQRLPPAYLIENTAFQYNWKSEDISIHTFQTVCSALGEPVCLDAAQFGSRAHRVRNFWTNLCSTHQLASTAAHVKREPNLYVADILAPGRTASPVLHEDREPYYPCNCMNVPLCALPTIVSRPQSYAFLLGKQGAVWDGNTQQWSEPTADECELAMGYASGSTAAPGVTHAVRRAVMGRCMDANTLQCIYAIAAAWYRTEHWVKRAGQLVISIASSHAVPQAGSGERGREREGVGLAHCLAVACSSSTGSVGRLAEKEVVLAAAADAEEKALSQNSTRAVSGDVWEDKQLLHFLRERKFMSGTTEEERRRIRKRSAKYRLASVGSGLLRILGDGSTRQVPRTEQRVELIGKFHSQCGHYGVRRTAALIQTSFWWGGLLAQVAEEVAKCKLCSRVRASFNSQQPTLQPLPIHGMFYRWGVDLAGPFVETAAGNLYVMIMIEHFSKHVEIVALPNKLPATTAAAFVQHVLGRFGSPAEVLTDRGGEWADEFAAMLQRALIDHRRTSAGRPQSDGLTERCVQTMKQSLSKMCAERGNRDNWDKHLPWLALGYRCSPQKSTGLSPYQLLYARTPIVPPAIRERIAEPVSFDNPELAAADYLQRAQQVQELCVIAGDNLRIAQHRDTLRYAAVRDGSYLPRFYAFRTGDFIYLSRPKQSTLDIKAKPLILRVHEVRDTGVLRVQGRCSRIISVHASKCAPCHLPDIDPTMDPSLTVPEADLACHKCHDPGDEARMLLCDNCEQGCHTYCCEPPLDKVPKGVWVCNDCEALGVKSSDVGKGIRERAQRELQQARADDLTPAEKRAKAHHGRLVTKEFYHPPRSRRLRMFWGRLSFRGPGKGDNLLVHYADRNEPESCSLRNMAGRGIKLMPEGTPLPSGIIIATAMHGGLTHQHRQLITCLTMSGPAPQLQLPAVWDLSSTETVQGALQLLMPGVHSAGHAAGGIVAMGKLVQGGWNQKQETGRDVTGTPAQPEKARRSKGGNSKGRRENDTLSLTGVSMQPSSPHACLGWTPTLYTEVLPLTMCVDFSACHSFVEPFCGAGTIARCIGEYTGQPMLTNDVDMRWSADLHRDALQPVFYVQNPAQVVVTAPPIHMLDLAAPLLSNAVSCVACMLVPVEYITSPTDPRTCWLHGLLSQDRVHILMGLPSGPLGRRCAWLLVFATSRIKQQMLKC